MIMTSRHINPFDVLCVVCGNRWGATEYWDGTGVCFHGRSNEHNYAPDLKQFPITMGMVYTELGEGLRNWRLEWEEYLKERKVCDDYD